MDVILNFIFKDFLEVKKKYHLSRMTDKLIIYWKVADIYDL